MDLKRQVSFATVVRAAPETVYDAFATAEGLDSWFTTGTELDARPGGTIVLRWKDWGTEKYTGEHCGPVLEADRPNRFSFRWPVDSGGYETTVEMAFKPDEEGTLVELVEHGFREGPDFQQDMLNRASGWAQAITLLKFYVEHGVTY
jgi:uncharacterized protein YndB with AHSA1/START domain